MLKEQRYNILLVSSSEKFNKNTINPLQLSIYADITISRDIEQARRLIVERKFDIVILDSPVGSNKGFNFILSICDSVEFGILTIVKMEDYDEAYFRLHDFGVYVLSKPVDENLLTQSLRIICLTRDKINDISNNNLSKKDKLDEIKLIAEAKMLIVKKLHITEEQAHKLIEQTSMNMRITKKMTALMFIKKYS